MSTERTILATLILDTALHIGVGKGGKPTDSPLRRTAAGRLVLPGRAIGGSLRASATRLAPRLGLEPCKALQEPTGGKETPCRCLVCQLFGELYPDENDNEEKGGAASYLWISDAFCLDDALSPTHIRDGVGISRATGAAARQAKFDYEVVPRATKFELRLRLIDDESPEAKQRAQLLAATLAEWQAGRGQLGGNVARGLGRFHLESLCCRKTNLNSADDLVAYLENDEPWQIETINLPDDVWLADNLEAGRKVIQSLAGKEEDIPAAGGFVTVKFTLAFDGPFLTNDPLVAMLSGFDHAPLLELALTSDGSQKRPVVSGASLRGVLRTRAEKIARTLATLHWRNRDEFLEHCPACDPLVGQASLPLAACDKRLNIPEEAEVVDDDLCLACRLFGNTRRGSRLWVEDAHWAGLKLNADTWQPQDFVAIDRFTSGGQEHAKFDAAPLIGTHFNARLTLYDPQDWELGWLLLALRDLAEGELTIGFGAAKGYGYARATDFCWTIGYLTIDDFPGDSNLLGNPGSSGIYQLVELGSGEKDWLPSGWLPQAQQWVDRFTQMATEFEPGEEWEPLQDDTFFDEAGRIVQLYGLSRVEEIA